MQCRKITRRRCLLRWRRGFTERRWWFRQINRTLQSVEEQQWIRSSVGMIAELLMIQQLLQFWPLISWDDTSQFRFLISYTKNEKKIFGRYLTNETLLKIYYFHAYILYTYIHFDFFFSIWKFILELLYIYIISTLTTSIWNKGGKKERFSLH